MLTSRNWLGMWIFALLTSLVVYDQAFAVATYKDAVLADSPRYYWTFDEASGNAANYGAGSGGVLQSQGGVRAASGTNGGGLSLGTASSHDGTASHLFSTNNGAGGGSLLNDSTYSSYAIEFWIKPAVTPNVWYISETAVNTNSVIVGFQTTKNVEYFTNSGRTTTSGPVLTVNAWNHVVIGFKDTAGTDVTSFYLNGASAGTSTAVTNRTFLANTNFIEGTDLTGAASVNGLIDEIALYNLTSLTQVQYDAKLLSIAGHFSAAVPEPTSLILVMTGIMGLVSFRRGALVNR